MLPAAPKNIITKYGSRDRKYLPVICIVRHIYIVDNLPARRHVKWRFLEHCGGSIF